jgi:hypothetical protein
VIVGAGLLAASAVSVVLLELLTLSSCHSRGWKQLRQHFATSSSPTGKKYLYRPVQIVGTVHGYRDLPMSYLTTTVVAEEGLFLGLGILNRCPVAVPWSKLREGEPVPQDKRLRLGNGYTLMRLTDPPLEIWILADFVRVAERR